MRPGLTHLNKQAKSQIHHLNKPDCLKLSNYERHWVKIKKIILAYIAKIVHALIYLTAFINFCTKIFYKIHKFFPYESPESQIDLAIKNVKVNPR